VLTPGHLWLAICGFLGKLVNEMYTLGDLGVVPNGTIQLQLQSTDPVNHPLQLIRPRQEYHMPDVITVRIHIGLFLFTIHFVVIACVLWYNVDCSSVWSHLEYKNLKSHCSI